jgi:hypothetical protein
MLNGRWRLINIAINAAPRLQKIQKTSASLINEPYGSLSLETEVKKYNIILETSTVY